MEKKSSSNRPLLAYQSLIDQGKLRDDPTQRMLIEELDYLHAWLEEHKKTSSNWQSSSWMEGLKRFFIKDVEQIQLSKEKQGRQNTQDYSGGLYIHGGVGRGKTMLVNLFYDCLNLKEKQRLHFHEFMIKVHELLKKFRQKQEKNENVPIINVAKAIARGTRVLCFDEFYVNDIADAMILGRLFQALLEEGVVIISTSNASPDQLYKGGLKRDNFLPFIALIKQKMKIIAIDEGHDHRLEGLKGQSRFTLTHGSLTHGTAAYLDGRKEMEGVFRSFAQSARIQPLNLKVKGRDLCFNQFAIPMDANDNGNDDSRGILLCGFSDIMEQPLGAEDFLKLSEACHTIILLDVPQFTNQNNNIAQRFITFIDVIYDRKIEFFMNSAVSIDKLYPEGGRLSFAFDRTTSRLIEMQQPQA